MKILVGQHELKIDKKDKVNQNEYKVTKCEFEFDEAITNDLVKIALFTNSKGTYKQYIINNECDIPAEILEKQETTTLGVYAYKEENEELELRYSPEEIKFYVSNGSYKENAENTEPITPTDKEQMEQALQNGLNDINDKIDEVDEKLDGIDTAIEETNNLNLDVSDKVDGDVTVTLTKKDASTKSVVISDGTSLQFMWQGTSLGIKTDDMEEYVFVDLQGIQGIKGDTGEPFTIKKTYSSVAEMNADFNNMEYGDYVMIASSVEVEDNAKLYTRGESQWIFITDFSGATGIRGPVGATPNIQIGSVTSGSTPSVTRTGTDENPILNFVLQPGPQGEVGPTGLTGNGISSITKTGTSGLVDTYTITFTNGNTTTFDVTNGKGIDRIEKTATVGNIDTYTIYFNDNSTSTFEVANGEVTKEELQEEVDRLSMIYNLFPTTSDEDTEMTLDGTGEVKLKKIGLKGNTSQETTTGANILNPSYATTNCTVSGNDITITGSGTDMYLAGGYSATLTTLFTVPAGTYYALCTNSKAYINVYGIYDGETTIRGISSNGVTFNQTFYAKGIRIRSTDGTTNLQNEVVNLYVGTPNSYEPYTNGASPNPDYPQDIQVVSGDNTIKVEGKNLFDINSCPILEYAFYDGNGNPVSWAGTCGIREYIKLDENSTYAIKYNGSNNFIICFYDKNKTYLSQLTKASGGNFTMPSTAKYIRFGIATVIANVEWCQIEKGTTATTYEPYQSQSYPVSLGVENLFDGELELGGYSGGTGEKQSASDNYRNKNIIKVEPNTTYTLSINGVSQKYVLFYYTSSQSFIRSTTNLTTGTFTTPNDCYYINFRCFASDFTSDFANLKVQLEKSSKASPYTPYGTTPIELCKIEDYQDKIAKSTGKNLFDGVFRQGNRFTDGLSDTKRLFTTQNYPVKSGVSYTLSTTINTSTYKWAVNLSTSEYPIPNITPSSQYYDSGWKTSSSFTFTPSQDSYLGIVIAKLNGTDNLTPNDISSYQFMLNKGTTALPYEPYGKVWYLNKQIGKVILNGSESSLIENSATKGLFQVTLSNVINNIYTINAMANWLRGDAGSRVSYQTYSESINNTIGTYNSNRLFFRINDYRENLAGLKTFLSSNNLIAYYVLATPTITEITDTTLIEQLDNLENAYSYDTQTNITQTNDDMPFILDVEALMSLKNIFNS